MVAGHYPDFRIFGALLHNSALLSTTCGGSITKGHLKNYCNILKVRDNTSILKSYLLLIEGRLLTTKWGNFE